MNTFPKLIMIDVENVFFPASELYQDALNLSFVEVTKGKIRFDRTKEPATRLSNSFFDVADFIFSFKPRTMKMNDELKKELLNRFVANTEKFLIKGKFAGTHTEHLNVLKWFAAAEIPIVFCTNLSYEIVLKYLDATGYIAFSDTVLTPDRMKNEFKLGGFPKPSREMYLKVVNSFTLQENDILSIEGTKSGIFAAKSSKVHLLSCANPELFTLVNVKKALESMEFLTIQ